MRGLWIFMILGNMLSCAVESQSSGICDDKPEVACVPAGGSVLIPCPNLTANAIKYRLIQGGKVIFTHMFERKAANSRKVRADLEVLVDTKNNTFDFRLIGVNGSHHDIYRCEGEIIFPPPKGILQNNQTILLLVEGHQCKKGCLQRPTVHCDTWIWAVAAVSAYALFASVFAVVNWVKLRQTDTQSDYVNTKPPAPRGQRWKT